MSERIATAAVPADAAELNAVDAENIALSTLGQGLGLADPTTGRSITG
jgi:hypothetical protein